MRFDDPGRSSGYGSPVATERPFPAVPAEAVPWLSVEQMIEVDRLMIEEMRIALIQMMENAGRNLAMVARSLLGGAGRRSVLVLAGAGGNGGGGMVAARHLAGAGAQVRVALASERAGLAEIPLRQLAALEAIGVPTDAGPDTIGEPDLIVDALLGYSGRGAPEGRSGELVTASAGHRVLALDSPTGLELSSGAVPGAHVTAEATMTLALPKEWLRGQDVRRLVGRLLLADISVPPAVYERMGLDYVSPFSEATVVEIEGVIP